MTAICSPLVSSAWLFDHLDDPTVRIIDVRWEPRYEQGRGTGFDDFDAYQREHIPGAVFAKMAEDLADPQSAFPDMLVDAKRFAEVMGRLGISNDHLVVAYDNTGVPRGAARLWWALSYYGHDNVRVLDGGLRQWKIEGYPLSDIEPTFTPATFVSSQSPGWLATKKDVIAALDDPTTVIIDCLTPEQYRGDGNRHPWGNRPGHIPRAVNIPAIANVDPSLSVLTAAEQGKWLEHAQSFRFANENTLRELYRSIGVTPTKTVITYCGRGFAASCGLLALRSIGHLNARLYDGSWAEWSAESADRP
jgi:thiosulfate/3-mercaptopyruvate sulfurtransferase